MNISHTKGDTFFRNITFKNNNGDVVNITGSDIIFSLKKNITDTTPLIQQTATIIDATNGEANITIANTIMNIDTGNYYFDIQWTDIDSIVRTIIKGNFTITYEITN